MKALFRLGLLTATLGVTAAAVANDGEWKTYPQSLGDVMLYTKPKSNLNGLWQEELGLMSRLATYERFTLLGNIAWVSNYPIKFPQKSQWTAGLTVAYQLEPSAHATSVYTKTKSTLAGLTQQETGFLTTLGAFGPVRAIYGIAYIFNYPYKSNRKPIWTTGVTLNVPLKW